MDANEAGSENILAQFESDPQIIFILDQNFSLIYCNSAWEKFAAENGGKHLVREKLIGCNVIAATPAPLRPFYLSMYGKVLSTGEGVHRLYECSSPEMYRRYLMRVERKVIPDHGACLVVINALVAERPIQLPDALSDRERLRDADGMIIMCSHCRKVKLPFAEGKPWVWNAEAVRTMPPGISHGLCPACIEIYYGQKRHRPANPAHAAGEIAN